MTCLGGLISAAHPVELMITTVGQNLGFFIDGEKLLNDKLPLVFCQLRRILCCQEQPAILITVVGVAFQLFQERRHQVDCDPGPGFGDRLEHLAVILDAMQPGPGKQGSAADRIPIVGLVHMPEDADLQWRCHAGLLSRINQCCTFSRYSSSRASACSAVPASARMWTSGR